MTMVSSDSKGSKDHIKGQFLALTGLRDVEVVEKRVGPETFLSFLVGRDAPLYRRVLAVIDREIGPENEFHGRLSLEPLKERYSLKSGETDLLASLINRSLRVTSDKAFAELIVEFAPFRRGEERTIAEPANHVILGRRGVGKSSLILLGVRKVLSAGHIPVWVDLQPYRGGEHPGCVVEILQETIRTAQDASRGGSSEQESLAEVASLLDRLTASVQTPREVEAVLPKVRQRIKEFSTRAKKHLYVFLDDAHLISPQLQPFLFEVFHSVLKGAGGWLKIASVKNLTRLYDSSQNIGLQIPHDAQAINLDLTLTDPGAARDHLLSILTNFVNMCGISTFRRIISEGAIDRLVWCSAGVPRDFLYLLQSGIQNALQNRRNRVGVQEVNLAVGEFGHQKMEELTADSTEDAANLRLFLDNLQAKCLDELRCNSFLARQAPGSQSYERLQKLMDLRLVHLLHPSITPSRAGERFEAYLLDYSFYTGMRRRQGLQELQISSESPPRYAELRTLPRVDLETLLGVG